MNRPLRIAVVGMVPFSSTGGGVPARVREIARSLVLNGAEVTLFCHGSGRADHARGDSFTWEGITVHTYGELTGQIAARRVSSRLPLALRPLVYGRIGKPVISRIAAEIEKRTPPFDVVIGYNQDVWYASRLIRAARASGARYIQQYAEMHSASDYPAGALSSIFLWERLHAHVIPRRADGAFVISRYLKDWVDRRAVRESLLVPTLAEIPATPVTRDAGEPMFVAVSRGDRRDSLELVLDGLALARERNGRIRFTIAGLQPRNVARLDAVARSRGISDAVTLKSFVSDTELQSIYSAAAGFVLVRSNDVSSAACFASRVAEYFSYGVPVILTDVGDYSMYFQDGQDALLIPPDDAGALAEQLVAVAQNPAKAAAIGAAGTSAAKAAFDPRSRGRQLADYCEFIVQNQANAVGLRAVAAAGNRH